MLRSQLETQEEPTDALIIEIDRSSVDIVGAIVDFPEKRDREPR